MMLLDLDRWAWLNLAVGLDAHAIALRDGHGIALPPELEELRGYAWKMAKGDTGRQDTTSLDDLADLLQRRPVAKVLLTLDEAGEALGRSRRHVERLIKAGQLVAVQFGGGMRVRPADLERFAAGLAPAGPIGERLETKSPTRGQQPTPGRVETRRPVPVSRGGAA